MWIKMCFMHDCRKHSMILLNIDTWNMFYKNEFWYIKCRAIVKSVWNSFMHWYCISEYRLFYLLFSYGTWWAGIVSCSTLFKKKVFFKFLPFYHFILYFYTFYMKSRVLKWVFCRRILYHALEIKLRGVV